MLSVRTTDGVELSSLDAVPEGATVIYTAGPGWYLSAWASVRVGACDAGLDNAARDPVPRSCAAAVVGESFGRAAPAPVFSPLPCFYIVGANYGR